MSDDGIIHPTDETPFRPLPADNEYAPTPDIVQDVAASNIVTTDVEMNFIRAHAIVEAGSTLSAGYIRSTSSFNVALSTIPFNLLALEIVTEILLFVPSECNGPLDNRRRINYLLGRVCRLFYCAIRGDGRFWSWFAVDENTDLTGLAERVTLAKDVKISLDLCMLCVPDLPEPFQLATQGMLADDDRSATCEAFYRHRWTSALNVFAPKYRNCVRMYVSSTMEVHTRVIIRVLARLNGAHIQDLVFDVRAGRMEDQRLTVLPRLFSGETPDLKSLLFQDVYLLHLQPMASTITHLGLWMESEHYVLTGPDLRALLGSTTALTSLDMICVKIDEADPHLGQPLQLSWLTKFHLVVYDDVSLIPITELNIPSLRTFRICAYEDEASSLVTMGGDLCATVTSLVMDFGLYPPSAADLGSFFKSFSHLEKLDLRPMIEVGSVLKAMIMHWSDVSPSLRCIWLDETLDDITIASIIAKANSTHLGSNLHLVSLRGHNLDGAVVIPYESYIDIHEGMLVSRALGYDTFEN